MRNGVHANGLHGSRRRRMHRRRHIAIGRAERLPFEHFVAGFYQRYGLATDVLAQRNHQSVRNRDVPDRGQGGLNLVG